MSPLLENKRVVLFDAAFTLIEPHPSVGAVYALAAARRGLQLDPETLTRRFFDAWRDAPAPDPAAGERGARDWWRRVHEAVMQDLVPAPRMPALFCETWTRFARANAWKLCPGARDTLRGLRARGIRLGLVSNADGRMLRTFSELELLEYFEATIFSAQVRAAKPDPGIFRRALDVLGAAPREALHVGDGRREDAEAALGAGLGAVWIDRRATGEPPPQGAACIAQLSELLE